MADRGAWAEIDLAVLEQNIREIKGCVKNGARFCAVVKADAYGHGAIAVARKAVEMGADYLAVAVTAEATELRRAGFTVPILILGGIQADEADIIVDNDITQAVFTMETAEALSAAAVRRNKTVRVHMAVDTGMGRIGVRPDEAGMFAAEVSALPNVELEGMFSHFALSDAKDKSYAQEQFSRFKTAMESVEAAGIKLKIRHIANSAAILEMPETHLDMVRAGIILYGLWPSDEVEHVIDLQPVMKVKARITYVKDQHIGETVSYGRTWAPKSEAVLATLPLGYADGYTRLYAGKAKVALKGTLVPVVGRICMDQCMVDVTSIADVKVGDTVTVFGDSGITADTLAGWIGTINYEVTCMMSPRLPRVYTGK